MLSSRPAPTVLTSHDKSENESLLSEYFIAYCNKRSIIDNDGTYNTLVAIERFVDDCIASDQAGYRITRRKSGEVEFHSTPLGRSHFGQINDYLSRFSKEAFYSPAVDIFFSSCKALNLIDHTFSLPGIINNQGVSDAELFNSLIDRIRDTGKSPWYRKRVAKVRNRAFIRFLGLVNYVDALFDRVRSRLIVIRLDLKYHTKCARNMAVGQAQEDLKHFFDNMRSKPSLFDDLAGYIWKIECGDHCGEHFHVFLFFTNDRMQNDCHRAQQIGTYWERTITKGRGSYFNCNTPEYTNKFDQLGRLAIGQIEYHDDAKRFNLLTSLAYICKEVQIIREKPKQRSRTYGRGEMPRAKENSTGRPRAVLLAPRSYLVRGGRTSSVLMQ